ncbi:TetR/AcrR family transcriptional regulator [Curtobacterium sp. VKM Ac-2922]|uniref:TetR/AcrR family transcriptional regulator n=1 Tax=Curtobacterium sp. VKM Ac-2922 TaxID=2929475 RepID=UPI001FB37083|nr:TetR/AcrR family transcriptional regulator [Curtobacterium sp. VKM Ac-2922]MCJ1712855.1 TetR/AcrR family transcriptional regulator [Curtobacterium sp. VKM Ac-2922]
MSTRPFHHGNLRAVLLDEAEEVLRQDGVDGISLRDLARRAGVSHGAPRSHFPDRQALLDALAERGFVRLTALVERALGVEDPVRGQFVRVARVYVDFAIDDAALMELMFSSKGSAAPEPVRAAAGRLFHVLDAAMGDADQTDDSGARERFTLLFAATMQGIAALVASGRVPRSQGSVLVDDAMAALLTSELGVRAVTRPGV